MPNAFSKLGQSLLGGLNNTAGFADTQGIALSGSAPYGSGANSFASLGAFASQVDQSAQRSYIENGLIANSRPRSLEILSQAPDMVIVVKKRMFSSLAENYRYDLMDKDEKLFVKAVKRLFYNKCQAIAAYEQLTKIETIAINTGGAINDTLLPAIFGATDALNSFAPGLLSGATQTTLDTIRKVKAFSDPSNYTSWVVDPNPTNSVLGEGTGVFELTMATSFSCNNSVNFQGGKGSLHIEDPYKLMIITLNDIDKAISETANAFTQNAFTQLTESTLTQTIDILKNQLANARSVRGVPAINFIINQNSLLYRKVRAII